jgi:hypothetical protein
MSTDGAPPSGRFNHRTTQVLPFPPLPPHHRRESDRAIVTWVAGKEARAWFATTGPAMAQYARRLGADLVVLEGYAAQPYLLANKFRVRQVFDEYGYSRLMYVDADVLVTHQAENLFEVASPSQVAILNEGKIYDEWTLAQFRHEALALLRSQGIEWHGVATATPYNSGLYVLSSEHASALDFPREPFPLCYRNGATVEQTWMTLNLARMGADIEPLRFPDQHWLWYIDQKERSAPRAQFLHFCGLAHSPTRRRERIEANALRLADDALERPDCSSDANDPLVPSGLSAFDQQLILRPNVPSVVRIDDPFIVASHRHGWSVAIKSLAYLADPEGVLVDGFVERTFLWRVDENRDRRRIPYDEPWLGFVHHPPELPDWPSLRSHHMEDLDAVEEWKASLDSCLGLYALSNELANWARARWNVNCESLLYPTITPLMTFDPDRFFSQPTRTVAHVGLWLRRFTSFARLDAGMYAKVQTSVADRDSTRNTRHILDYMLDEQLANGNGQQHEERGPIVRPGRLLADDYDDLLATSVVFLDLISASGVTSIVECLARATPVLVNRLPAVEEYLGVDYPLFYSSLEHAAALLSSDDAVRAAHEHMLANPVRPQLSPSAFVSSFAGSEGYQRALWAASKSKSV